MDNGPVKVTVNMCLHQVRILDETLLQVQRNLLRRRLWRVLHRRNVVERSITHNSQKTRNNQLLITGWGQYIQEKMHMTGVTHDKLCNFDETNVFFAPERNKTLAHRGSREVGALKLAESSQQCTAMIGVSGSGYKLPPYIVLKGSDSAGGVINRQLKQVEAAARADPTLKEVRGYPTSNFYGVQEKAWMSSRLIVDWMDKVVRPWAATKEGPCMVILDEFTGHMTCEVRDAIVSCGCFLEFVPGGYTWRLQVMDVGINKPFKDYICDEYDQWHVDSTTLAAKPQREDVAKWIAKAFNAIKISTVKRTWNKVGVPCPPDDVVDIVEDKDVEVEEDGAGVDFLDYVPLGTKEYSEEELEAEAMYNDCNDE